MLFFSSLAACMRHLTSSAGHSTSAATTAAPAPAKPYSTGLSFLGSFL